jgi:hypothetical protein
MSRDFIKCDWNKLTSYLLNRYPNEKRPDILSIDILDRRMVGKKLFLKRIVTMENFGMKMYGLEEIEIDSEYRTYEIISTNINYQNIIKFIEKCQYNDINGQTEIIKDFSVDGNSFIGNILTKKYRENAKIGKDILSDFITDKSFITLL